MLDRARRMTLIKEEGGFTLIELLATMALASILLTLGAAAARQYWFNQALNGAQDEVVTQLRQLQERVVSETHPRVYGARFHNGHRQWGLVRYDPAVGTTPVSCVQYQTREFPSGVKVAETSFAADVTRTSFCQNNLKTASGASVPNSVSSQFVFFYSRGTATPGNLTGYPAGTGVVLKHDALDRVEAVSVTAITGRVDEQ